MGRSSTKVSLANEAFPSKLYDSRAYSNLFSDTTHDISDHEPVQLTSLNPRVSEIRRTS